MRPTRRDHVGTEAAPIFDLSDEIVAAFAEQSPVQATFAGLAGPHDRWGDYSPDGYAAWDARLVDYERRLAALAPAQDRFEQLAVRVMADYLAEKRCAF